jgi:hypothetical protein
VRLGVEAALVEGVLVPGDVEVDGGRVAAVGLSGRGRGIAVPGFVDLHVHGFAGVDFAAADAAGYRRAGEALLATGVTAFQPSFVTAPEDELTASLREVPDGNVGARVIGCHLEGPFISPARLGMHPAAARRDPDRALLERLLAAGPVTHVTLAPELDGAFRARRRAQRERRRRRMRSHGPNGRAGARRLRPRREARDASLQRDAPLCSPGSRHGAAPAPSGSTRTARSRSTRPFGGYKESGFGRVNGAEAVDGFLQTKSVWVETSEDVPDPFVMRV